jgi:hypothetical protein
MAEFSFLAVPNVEGMRLWWYIQIFGIVILFGICLFFVLYFWLKYRRRQVLTHHLDEVDQQTQDLQQHLLIQHIKKASDKTKLVLFIEYLEKFVTTKSYANIWELLLSQGFSSEDIELCEQVMYADKKLSSHLEMEIDKSFAIK